MLQCFLRQGCYAVMYPSVISSAFADQLRLRADLANLCPFLCDAKVGTRMNKKMSPPVVCSRGSMHQVRSERLVELLRQLMRIITRW